MDRNLRSIFALVAVAVVSLLSVGNAAADDFTIKFDDAVIDAGWDSLTPGVDGNTDLPIEPDDVVMLEGTVQGGQVNIPAAGVTFKREVRAIKFMQSAYTVDWKATSSFTGLFDAATGQMDLMGSLEQTVKQGTNVCVSDPLPLKLSTESSTTLNSGRRFTEGLGGSGALVGKWVAPAVLTKGPDCDLDLLDCRARRNIAGFFGDVALSTGRELRERGPASFDPCDGIPQPVGGPKSVAISSSPGTLGETGMRSGSYQLDFLAGDTGARFTISLGVPGWPDRRVWGSPLSFGEVNAMGVESIEPLPLPPLSPSVFECFSGAPSYGTGYEVEMKPNRGAIVTLPIELATNPWTLGPLTPRITISYFNGQQELQVPPIAVNGRLGPWVKVWTKGRKNSNSPVRADRPFTLVGHVYGDGLLEGRKVKLWSESTTGEKQGLGKARINAKGNFGKKVKAGLPLAPGYRIKAKLIGSKVAPSCGNRITVKI